jgi:ParB family transcriptional regulator, chromosome partitioning protein
MIEDVDIGLIYVTTNVRRVDKDNVKRLMQSISEIGLLNPLVVRRVIRHKGITPMTAYSILSGRHRFEAACNLKWTKVRCDVVEMNDLHAELVGIDENLIRANLTPAQEAAAVSRRKEIYEALHPETKHHVAGAHAANKAMGRDASDNLSFASSTAEATGKDKRSVERAAARGAALGDDLVAVEGTSLDKGVELDALAKMAAGERSGIIEKARRGENVSARTVKPAKLADERKAENGMRIDLLATKPVQVPVETLDRVDAWIVSQPDPKPSRPEAIRRLVEKALASAP